MRLAEHFCLVLIALDVLSRPACLTSTYCTSCVCTSSLKMKRTATGYLQFGGECCISFKKKKSAFAIESLFTVHQYEMKDLVLLIFCMQCMVVIIGP